MTISVSELRYADLTLGDAREGGHSVLAQLLWTWLHSFNSCQPAEKLGIDIPDWVPGEETASNLERLRLLGTQCALSTFLAQPRMRKARVMGLHASAPAAIPAAAAFAALRRDNAADKAGKPSAVRRMARRQGEQAPQPSAPKPAALKIVLHSSSGDRAFPLMLKKQLSVAAQQVRFNNYGLTTEGAMPQF